MKGLLLRTVFRIVPLWLCVTSAPVAAQQAAAQQSDSARVMSLAHRLGEAYAGLQASRADGTAVLGHARQLYAAADSLARLTGPSPVWRFYRAAGAAPIAESLLQVARRTSACADARAARAMADTLRRDIPANDLTDSPAISDLTTRSFALDSATAAQLDRSCPGAPGHAHRPSNEVEARWRRAIGYDPSLDPVPAADIRVGVPFTVTVRTTGTAGRTRAAGAEVRYREDGEVVEIVPHDERASGGTSVCLPTPAPLSREVVLEFESAGPKTLRVIGRRASTGAAVTLKREITVAPRLTARGAW